MNPVHSVWGYRHGTFATGQTGLEHYIISTRGIGTFSTGQHTIHHRRRA